MAGADSLISFILFSHSLQQQSFRLVRVWNPFNIYSDSILKLFLTGSSQHASEWMRSAARIWDWDKVTLPGLF